MFSQVVFWKTKTWILIDTILATVFLDCTRMCCLDGAIPMVMDVVGSWEMAVAKLHPVQL
jgi:hypothetical protein